MYGIATKYMHYIDTYSYCGFVYIGSYMDMDIVRGGPGLYS